MNIDAADAGGRTDLIVREVVEQARHGNHARAYELADAALGNGVRHPALFNVRAVWYGREQRYEEALSDFESARAYFPRDAALLDSIGHCLTMLARLREAVAAFDAAIAVRPEFVQAHYRRGAALGLLNDVEEMRQAHERVVALNPDHADALASLAFIAARAGDYAVARGYGLRATARLPHPPIALVALAIAEMGDGDFPAAKQRLEKVVADARSDDGRLNMALGFAADAWDAQGCTSEAFALYSALNNRRRNLHAARFCHARAIDDVSRLVAYFERNPSWAALKAAPSDSEPAAVHVFLLGFVRSGTTLLETVLASHPEATASDERDFLADAAHAFLDRDEDLDRLAVLEDVELDVWRDAYWKSVRESGASAGSRVFVDKVPLNSLRLPLIGRLFPEARVLLALRDPRDVVFSTFRHRFNMSPSSFEFLQLEDCARYYAAVMRFVAKSRQDLPLHVLEHRYEDMIADFDGAIRRVCEFIGLDWLEAMRDFTNAAQTIDRQSQSASQVRRGLYRGAIAQWQRYKEHLSPAMPILEPWIDRFGYFRE